MKRVLAACAAASWLFACGGSQTMTGAQQFDQSQTQKPVSPKGFIFGRVLDVATGNPLEGATVKVLGGAAALTTDADGSFKFEGAVVSSTYTFVIEKAGYVRARTTASISGTTGNSPLEGSITSFTMELFPATGSITGYVFLPNGSPAANVPVSVSHTNGGYGEGVVSAATGADGAFSLSGLATRPTGASHNLRVGWLDTNGDMQADYGDISDSVTVFPGQAARRNLYYSSTSVGQTIVASNVTDGEVPPGEDLQFTFALPLFTGTLSGSGDTERPWVLTHASGNGVDVPVEGTFMSPTVLRVRPALNSLREGELYTLSLRLRNANTGSNVTSNYTGTFPFQVRSAMVMPFTTQVTALTITNASPTAPFGPTAFNSSASSFVVGFAGVAGAVRYEVYARDTLSNPNYVRVQQITSNGSPRYTSTVTLGAAFTSANPSGSALGGNNRVTFAVVPVDAFNQRAPLMSAPTLEVRDTIPPTVGALTGASFLTGTPVDAINDGPVAAEIRIRLTYSEAMDPMSTVTYTSTAAAAPTVAWRWESATTGILTLTVGANADATGSFVIRGGRDMAGNDVSQAGDVLGSLGGRREFAQNPEFRFSNACSLMSWMTTSQGGGATPTVVNNNGAIAGSSSPCAAVLGSVPGTMMPTAGISRLTQSVNLPSIMNTGTTLEASIRYRPVFVVNASNPGATYTMQCRFVDGSDTTLVGLFSTSVSSNTTSHTFTSVSGVSLNMHAGTSIRLSCEVENTSAMNIAGFGALYIDEVSVAQVKPGMF